MRTHFRRILCNYSESSLARALRHVLHHHLHRATQARRCQYPPPSPAGGGAAETAMLRAICDGAGIQPDTFDGAAPQEVAQEIGRALRIMTAELRELLKARTATKVSLRSGSRTMMNNEANSPLKFSAGVEDALGMMFGPGRPGYMRGAEAVQSGFSDVKKHQAAMLAAIQPALAELIDDLAPETIEKKVEGGRFSNKSARAWELFVERWDAKTEPYDNGILDVFNVYYSKAYDRIAQN
ncbi:type VI secretion system-associated FHA domain protein TagH [Tropicimonas sp. IMCC34011]|uniref:type VI secretion system-associated FHA domain protein TagH n=1 Tax=Tropicimonas sp. IMCC34011 TaxID=2248759 RepID=UPI002101A407|nr:type VI secretion system-associated FHA domain protein TagH [Tropicimonas sp. IMCC34011]